MRVGLNGRFYGARITGVQRFGCEVARRLADLVDLTLLLPADVPDPPDIPATAPRMRGRLRGHLWEHLELPRLGTEAGCDVLLHLSATAPVWGGPHVMAVHDVFPISHPEWFTRGFARWYRMSLGPAARHASVIITMSQWGKREIERWLRVPPERIRVVTQGLAPFEGPADATQLARVRDKWALADQYLLALGAGDARKNLSFLGDVMRLWRATASPAPQLVIAGEAFTRVHRGDPTRSGASDATILGYVTDEELRALYTGAAAFCFPSLGEGFGRPPLEAMACGTPVVAADYGCAGEVLGGAAEVLPLDAERWMDVLRRIMADGVAKARRAAGLAWVKRFGWDATAAQIADCCREAHAATSGRRKLA